MGRAVAVCLAATLIGAALMALLPEDLLGGGPLFSLNERHGPGRSDTIGLIVILGGWLWFHRALWLHRREMRPRWLAVTLALACVAALAGCFLALRADHDLLAFFAAACAAAAQFAIAALSHCKPARHRE